jgi:hypothetical protein
VKAVGVVTVPARKRRLKVHVVELQAVADHGDVVCWQSVEEQGPYVDLGLVPASVDPVGFSALARGAVFPASATHHTSQVAAAWNCISSLPSVARW